jgi:hypothetical protein
MRFGCRVAGKLSLQRQATAAAEDTTSRVLHEQPVLPRLQTLRVDSCTSLAQYTHEAKLHFHGLQNSCRNMIARASMMPKHTEE